MTRILHYFEPPTHGVPNYVAFLAQHQVDAGHEPVILGPHPRDIDGVPWFNDELRRRSLRSIHQSGQLALSIARDSDAEIIHAHSFFAGLTTRLLNPHVPVVYTPHAWSFERTGLGRRPSELVEQRLAPQTAKVLCVSEGAADAGRAVLGDRVPISSIGSAIDLERFQRVLPGQLQRDLQPYAVCVGRISEQKGQLDLAARWNERMADSDLTLVIVGDGHPDVAEDGYPMVEGNVHFAGASTDVPTWLAGAEMAVQPSRWEAMSLATIEALACGAPVVATDVAGMQEAITDGPLAPAGAVVETIDGLIDAVIERFEDEALLRRERRAARPRALKKFDPQSLVARTEREYAQVLGRAPQIATDLTESTTSTIDLEQTEIAA